MREWGVGVEEVGCRIYEGGVVQGFVSKKRTIDSIGVEGGGGDSRNDSNH